jgi:hypothetical protein
MRSASFAEWIIARFTTRARAVAIIGDLLEAVPEKGKFWFWLSTAHVVVSLTWRHALALAFAFYLFKYRPTASLRVELSVWDPEHVPVYSPPTLKMLFYMHLSSTGWFLRLGASYMAIRYGLKDLFVRHTLAAWVLVTVLSRYGHKSPQIEIACIALAGCGMVYSALSAERRKGLLALVCVIAVLFAWYKFSGPVVVLMFRVLSVVAPSQIMLALVLLGFLIQTLAFARVHRLFFENNSRSSENEPPDNAQVSADIS